MATAADVPTRFDVVIDGKGYVFADPQEIKAEFGVTPTFVERQNVQGDYGDNQQDFWLTATQRDWSLGEQQRYFRSKDEDSIRRYWVSSGVDVSMLPGQVSMRPAVSTVALGVTPVGVGGRGFMADTVYIATATNLYAITGIGATDKGAHGVGAAPTAFAQDGKYLYLSSESGTKVRKWDGTAFTDFSATPASKLVYLNNTLYGIRSSGSTSDLVRYDTAGVVTSLFAWKGADGSQTNIDPIYIAAFGGKLLIITAAGTEYSLWLYDGTGVSKLLDFDPNFTPHDLVVAQGQAFIPGAGAGDTLSVPGFPAVAFPTVLYYANGTVGQLWRGTKKLPTKSNTVSCQAFSAGLAINDPSTGTLLFWNAATGGISTLGATIVGSSTRTYPVVACDSAVFVFDTGTTTGYVYPGSGKPSSTTITTSLIDLDSSLDKRFHAVRVDFDSAIDGNGGTADVAYRLNDVDGSYTSLATGVTSGQEIAFTNVRGRSISIKVTLNKGTSTDGPVLKRIAVRASPIQPQFARATYVLNCTGDKRDPGSMVTLRDDTKHPKTGLEMVADLKTAAAKLDPIQVVDTVNGTLASAIIEADSLKFQAVRRGSEFLVQVTVRQV